jgi:hypothetical protein
MAIRRVNILLRRKLFQALESGEPAWKDSDHPELAEGSGAWVRRLRLEGQARYAKIEQCGQELTA